MKWVKPVLLGFAGGMAAVVLAETMRPPWIGRHPVWDEDVALRIDALAQRVGQIEHANDSPPPTAAPFEAKPERVAVANHDDGRVAALEARVRALEIRSVAAAHTPGSSDPFTGLLTPEGRAELIATATRIICDPRSKPGELVAAHEKLRFVPDAYTPAMVQALVAVGTTSPDSLTRSQIWANFDGASRFPQIVQPLLNALANDTSDHVRNEASETLGQYLDDPVVKKALENAAKSDSSQDVRDKAMRTLRSGSSGSGYKKL
jgi:hypothetical protein